VYNLQIYQIAESNRIETFLPELECSTGLVAVPRNPSDANHTMTTLAVEENALAQLGQLMSGQVL